MEQGTLRQDSQKVPGPIYVVSGGTGASGQAVVDRALSQFPSEHVPVVIRSRVSAKELETIVQEAAAKNGTVVHTWVEADLRQEMIRLAREHNVVAIDLLGRLLERLSQVLNQAPVERPGLYRQLHEAYFRRIEAIEYTVAHDDGQHIHDLDQADIVLTGVSRVSKTPVSIYLSVQGWKVANVPLILDQEPPEALFDLPPGRVVGLTVQPDRLVELRTRRGRAMGLPGRTAYDDLGKVQEELAWARLILRRGRFAVVDVTGRSIEESAQAVVDLVTRRHEAIQGRRGEKR
jgi:regulator of PEP synthase PpsR (kinase-PPPase family)